MDKTAESPCNRLNSPSLRVTEQATSRDMSMQKRPDEFEKNLGQKGSERKYLENQRPGPKKRFRPHAGNTRSGPVVPWQAGPPV